MRLFPKKHTNGGLPCISCTEVMKGIYSYEIREDCAPCGGKSKVERSRSVARTKRGLKAPAHSKHHDH